MADLCGPSNPLQNFQKATQQDRTLQQDRLVSRPGESSSFRSHDPAAGALDQEFEAFSAGHVPAPLPFSRPSLSPFHPPQPIAARASPAGVPDWALDFQRMNISSPAPSIVESKAPVAAATSVVANSRTAYQPSFQPQFQYGGQMNGSYGMPMMGSMGMGMNAEAQQTQTPQQGFDTAAFDRAFDAVTADWMESERELDELMSGAVRGDIDGLDQATFEINKTKLHESTIAAEPLIEEQRQAEERLLDPQAEADALAKTAGDLLDSVSHDTSDKFAQSSFLALMRQFRDHEVKVDGENLIHSTTNEIANTTGEASKLDLDQPILHPSEQDADLGRMAPIEKRDFGGES